MKYYFPDRPEENERRTEIPADVLVCASWQTAFRRALCGGGGEDPDMTAPALVYEIDVEANDLAAGRLLVTVGSRNSVFERLVSPRPVGKILEIDVDAWLLQAAHVKLSTDIEESFDEVLTAMMTRDPVLAMSQLGTLTILPGTIDEYLVERMTRWSAQNRG